MQLGEPIRNLQWLHRRAAISEVPLKGSIKEGQIFSSQRLANKEI
ncbi:hypothetical protein S1OALGB6SA_1966 [Olavius algarvensis spirochete endosymbiont]|nr:hypothetical protein S1OALGB6SA_1966 [Olavius algarvensis spirochete endosymbiont]